MIPGWFWIALAGLVAAVMLLRRAQRADERNWIIERAPPMPVGLVNPRDDAWLEGEIECGRTLTVPNFNQPCVYYDYKEEQRVQRTRMVNGRPMILQTWETRHQETRRVDFDLVERSGRITVRAVDAEFNAGLVCGPEEYAFNRRRSAVYMPCPSHASAVGSVSDDRRALERFRNIPLLVTLADRRAFIAGRETAESWLRFGGGFLLFAGLFGVLFGLSTAFNFPPVPESGSPMPSALLSLFAALLLFLGWLGIHLYNRLVMYRERVRTAWRHIDVDLKNRHDLIPQLVQVVKAYQEHESGLIEALSRLRYIPAVGETTGSAAAARVPDLAAVAERYPELKANPLFQELAQQLTAVEEKIAFARQFYNDNVLEYNNAREQFPTRVIVGLFPSFPRFELFDNAENG